MSGTIEPTPVLNLEPDPVMPETEPPEGATDESQVPHFAEPRVLERNDPTILRNPIGRPLRDAQGRVLHIGDTPEPLHQIPLDADLESITREGDVLGLVTRYEFNSLVTIIQEDRNKFRAGQEPPPEADAEATEENTQPEPTPYYEREDDRR
jgi:hypothetical protein